MAFSYSSSVIGRNPAQAAKAVQSPHDNQGQRHAHGQDEGHHGRVHAAQKGLGRG